MSTNLLNYITQGTTRDDFLKSFKGNTQAAAKHLRKFYVKALEAQGTDVPDDEALDKLEEDAENRLRRLKK